MNLRKMLGVALVVGTGLTLTVRGQEESPKHGRKYKAPPVTSHVEVTVLKAFNGKPISNAAVVFRSVKDGKDQGNLEVKTDPEGKAIIDLIPTGSSLRVQVIASGYATFGEDYTVDGPTKDIEVSMVRPKPQVSTYADKQEDRKLGVQEPARPKAGVPPAGSTSPATPPVSPPRPQSAPASVPGASSPPSV